MIDPLRDFPPVSYTHLDVYKRQHHYCPISFPLDPTRHKKYRYSCLTSAYLGTPGSTPPGIGLGMCAQFEVYGFGEISSVQAQILHKAVKVPHSIPNEIWPLLVVHEATRRFAWELAVSIRARTASGPP